MSSIRFLSSGQGLPWKSLIDLVGADSGCLPRVSLRDRIAVILVADLLSPAASILKQCMLSGGADALVHREVLTCKTEKTGAVVYGTPRALLRGCDSLENQPFKLCEVAEEIRKCLAVENRPEFLKINNRQLAYSDTPLIMGILNITPDSFSDGGSYSTPQAAAQQAVEMEKSGAAIIDVGGESTRPGSQTISARDQKARVLPVIEAIRRRTSVPLSIDTCIPEVAEAAVKAGAGMINSVNAMETPGMVAAAASLKVPVVLMHMKGIPETMQNKPFYVDAPGEIAHYLVSRVEALVNKGMPREMILVDPGIGFGKRLQDNLALIHSLEWIGMVTGCRVLLGHSRKSFLGSIAGISVADQRDSVSHIVTALATGADVIRVHDVPGTVAALAVSEALRSTL